MAPAPFSLPKYNKFIIHGNIQELWPFFQTEKKKERKKESRTNTKTFDTVMNSNSLQ
jgi:hypothetical protein